MEAQDREATWATRRGPGHRGDEGGQSLKRVIQREIADRLTPAMPQGRYQEGDTAEVDLEADTVFLR